jgi:hypothetical protein
MKTMVYSVTHKAQTVTASVMPGCVHTTHTKAINDMLGAGQPGAQILTKTSIVPDLGYIAVLSIAFDPRLDACRMRVGCG